jgi:hypothetical protein
MDADPRFFVQSLVLPWGVLDQVRELTELREALGQLEEDEDQRPVFVQFLEHEVQTVFDVTEKAFYTPEEEAAVYEELRASARVLRETLEVAMDRNLLECLSWCMSVSRNTLYTRIRDKAVLIEGILTPA